MSPLAFGWTLPVPVQVSPAVNERTEMWPPVVVALASTVLPVPSAASTTIVPPMPPPLAWIAFPDAVTVPVCALAVIVPAFRLAFDSFECTANGSLAPVSPWMEMLFSANRSIHFDNPPERSALTWPPLRMVMFLAQTSMQATESVGLPGRNVPSQCLAPDGGVS
jgi:hypothetical protein